MCGAQVVTRYIGKRLFMDDSGKKPLSNVFIREREIREGEISVFDIDDFLAKNDNNGIFQLGDLRVFRNKPHTIARADMRTSDIEAIESLRVEQDNPPDPHMNIRPIDRASAQFIALQLINISTIVERD